MEPGVSKEQAPEAVHFMQGVRRRTLKRGRRQERRQERAAHRWVRGLSVEEVAARVRAVND